MESTDCNLTLPHPQPDLVPGLIQTLPDLVPTCPDCYWNSLIQEQTPLGLTNFNPNPFYAYDPGVAGPYGYDVECRCGCRNCTGRGTFNDICNQPFRQSFDGMRTVVDSMGWVSVCLRDLVGAGGQWVGRPNNRCLNPPGFQSGAGTSSFSAPDYNPPGVGSVSFQLDDPSGCGFDIWAALTAVIPTNQCACIPILWQAVQMGPVVEVTVGIDATGFIALPGTCATLAHTFTVNRIGTLATGLDVFWQRDYDCGCGPPP